MSPQDKCRLSFYKEVSELTGRVKIVRHIETGRIFVRKELPVYDLAVYVQLKKLCPPHYPGIQELVVDDDGTLILIEEYISGQTLTEYLATNGPLPEDLAVALICKLCEAVYELHSAIPPIVHRDLKPDNIILLTDGSLRIVDLNSAKNIRKEARDTILIGTQGYAAPEQYGFGASNEKTDVYAIGIIFREMLVGTNISLLEAYPRYNLLIQQCTKMEAKERPSIPEFLSQLGSKRTPVMPSSETNDCYDSWLPVGFRSHNPLYMIFGALIYGALLYGLVSEVLNPSAAPKDRIEAIFTIIIVLVTAAWWGNYRHCQRHAFYHNSPEKSKRLLGVVLTFIFIFIALIIVDILVTIPFEAK